ncbi:hypothetical protein [Actinomadura gamaensis]|uniref:Uncharacterized protein n=1 Tax=Actinomadura gamaensis TaxID=1763541 RepID=A0ABV9UCG3_9ACTN
MSTDLPRRRQGETVRMDEHRLALGSPTPNLPPSAAAVPVCGQAAGSAKPLIVERAAAIKHLARLGMHLASHPDMTVKFDAVTPSVKIAMAEEPGTELVVTGGLHPDERVGWFYGGTEPDIEPLAPFEHCQSACKAIQKRLTS